MSEQQAAYGSITVVGPGLLGGSVAMAVRQHMPGCDLRVWARREQPLAYLREHGVTQHTYTDLQDAVRDAELVILATPIGCFESLAREMLPALREDALVTDVGSVKAYVHRTTGALLTQRGHRFIGSHPMAGTEKTGVENAFADLLRGATVALTNDHGVPAEDEARLAAFWQGLGCSTYAMTPDNHDRAVARVSHVPHVLAALCARAAAGDDVPQADLQRLAAGGFRDTTRVCCGPAPMWADILWENDVAVRRALTDCMGQMQTVIDLLNKQDKAGLRRWLETAADCRRTIRCEQETNP